MIDTTLYASAVREAVLRFSGVSGARPSTIIREALGYHSDSLYRWIAGEDVAPRQATLAQIGQWLTENQNWRPRVRGVGRKPGKYKLP